MPDQFSQGPAPGERRTDPNTGESRVWSGRRWESNPIGTVSPNEPDTYLGGFMKGGMQSLGDSKGRLAALGGLLGSFGGAPNLGAMAGTEVGNLAERMGGGDNTLLGDAARVGVTGATGWGLGKIFQGGQYLANKLGAGNAALDVASHLPIVGKYARIAQALGAGGEAPAAATAAAEVPGLSAAESAALSKQNYSPEVQARIGARLAPPAAAPQVPAAAPAPRPRLSTPAAPYTQGPEQMPNLLQEPTMNLDRLSGEAAQRIPITDRSTLPNIGGKTVMPNLSKTPTLKYGADVETAGDWNVPQAPEAPAGPMQGLQEASPVGPSTGPDAGLEKWISGGGTAETYARAKAGLDAANAATAAPPVKPNFNSGPQGSAAPFGPNTVGAAQAPPPPKFNTVDEAEGMSLLDQGAFESYKRNNPGADIDEWFRTHGQTEDTNAGLDIPSMVDKLTALLGKRP